MYSLYCELEIYHTLATGLIVVVMLCMLRAFAMYFAMYCHVRLMIFHAASRTIQPPSLKRRPRI
jgi:hypothetical protein